MSKKHRPKRGKVRIVKVQPKTRIAVALPKNAVPVIAVDPKGLLHVLPIPKATLKKKTWWEAFVEWRDE